MRINYLFPHRSKIMGWLLFIPSALLGLYILNDGHPPVFFERIVLTLYHENFIDGSGTEIHNLFFKIIENNILDEILLITTIIGALLIAFSKEKNEDELISKVRLDSLVWATYVNYIVLIISTIFVYEFTYLWVMVINMLTILIFFIIRFNWQLIKLKKDLSYEE